MEVEFEKTVLEWNEKQEFAHVCLAVNSVTHKT